MVYTASTSAHAQLSSGIATTSGEAKSFVSRLVMQTLWNFLQQQPERRYHTASSSANTVTALCTMMPMNSCKIEDNKNIGPIDSKHLSISGSLTTTNIIMANWSNGDVATCSE
ncbi:hypothetical protein KIN20_026934 [Parelaphostrongylus tenuis]|uniref:Uncharacterized protein n=1 Tax=Parelaphostrongylus tenuis TaxID=148309 RepID=A0AAD5WDC9_PARTN|nr:hypothetical protein KIN20_026934 [Parelaphostrongylus tenuis]